MPGGFIFDEELAFIKAGLLSWLAPYVKSTATTQAKANGMAQAAVDFIMMMNNAAKSPPVDPGPPA